MVTRINGAPAQGVFFSKDVRFLSVTATNGDFLADLQVKTTDPRQADVINSGLEQALEAVATRGTIIGISVASATVVQVIVDYAQAYDDAAVVTEVQDLIDLVAAPVDLLSAAIVVNSGFATAALGTPS